MDFEERLNRAIERGERARDKRASKEAEKSLSEEEFKRLYSQYRLEVTEHIESCLQRLANHFPGFQFDTIVSKKGWGAVIRRDDVIVDRRTRSRDNYFSLLQMLVKPFSSYHVLELVAKGTIRNKELYNRTHYQRLSEADTSAFNEIIDLWVVEYAEQYARTS